MSDLQLAQGSGSPNHTAASPQSKWAEFTSLVRTILLLIVLFLLFRGTIVEPFRIPSASMEPTLLIGDHILVSKLSYGFRLPLVSPTLYQWSRPQRGDIVVFTLPDDPSTAEDESATNFIKRVMGLPGDEIEVRGTSVFINGELYEADDAYARWLKGGVKDFYEKRIPDGKIFLMGDNRDFSRDSRFWPDHFLDISLVKGRAFLIYLNTRFLWRRMFTIVR